MPTALPDPYTEYSNYLGAHPTSLLISLLDDFRLVFEDVDFSKNAARKTVDLVVSALNEGRPFSMVRIGDGEGNILGHDASDYVSARKHSLDEILRMMFGTEEFTAIEIYQMADEMRLAISTSDVLGVSDPTRVSKLEQLRNIRRDQIDIRGHMGSYESIIELSKLFSTLKKYNQHIVSNYIHRDIMGEYHQIISAARAITMIGPYGFVDQFTAKFGRTPEQVIQIPNQASNNLGHGEKWFPVTYGSIIRKLQARPSDLFLVSAGLLGKAMCGHIKNIGGVALDIGSVADVWQGNAVRNYHDPAFIARHKLTPRD